MTMPNRLHRRGFALVVTLLLLVLLSVITLGLLSLSAVEMRSTSQENAQATARANARMALMLAIGELQKEMGPDSRISAPYDAGTSATGGQPHWTAVYDAWKWQDPSGMNPETPNSRIPKFRSWLVSGANQASGGLAGNTETVLLLGAGTIGDTIASGDEIRVPMIVCSSGKMPGRVAWWTADESMKAKITAGPDITAANSFGISDPLFNSQSPPNIGHRAFPKLEAFDWKTGIRAKTITTNSVNLALSPSSLLSSQVL